MKKWIFFIASVSGLSLCAQDSSKTTPRNSIEIEAFSPISTEDYSSASVTLGALSGQGNNIYIGTGLRYTRNVRKLQLILRAGMVIRNSHQDYKWHSNDSQEENFTDQKSNFTQKHFLFSVGLCKEERIKDIAVNMGFEMIYIYYGSSTFIGDSHNYSYYYGTTDIHSDFMNQGKTITGSGFATGAGFSLGVAYYISRYLKVTGRISEYFLATTFSKPTVSSGTTTWTTHYQDGTPDNVQTSGYTSTQEPNSTQVGFSKLTPSIGFVVCF